MTSVLWLLLIAVGLSGTVAGSKRAVADATHLASAAQLPPFVVGMTLLALGTDLPEIANSLVASYTDHGDVNVGDSVGSAATQLTVVLGMLPFLGLAIPLGERRSPLRVAQRATAWMTAGALVLVALAVHDGHLGRPDAALLIVVWIAGSRLVYDSTRTGQVKAPTDPVANRLRLVGRLGVAVVAIGVGATVALFGIIELAAQLGVPKFLVAFFGAALGTSLPEGIVAYTALRRGETALAVGDVFGSSFADATLSVSIGPLLFPTAVDGELGAMAALVAAAAAAIVGLLWMRGTVIRRREGAVLLLVYAFTWVLLI